MLRVTDGSDKNALSASQSEGTKSRRIPRDAQRAVSWAQVASPASSFSQVLLTRGESERCESRSSDKARLMPLPSLLPWL